MMRYKKYKPSGVEWIGEIPGHWNVKRLKYVTTNLDAKRVPLSSGERGIKKGEYPYYGATGIIDYVDGFIFDGKYVLVGEDGAPFFIQNRDVAFVATGKFWVNNHAHILETKNGLIPEILSHQLNLVDYRKHITGSTRDKLTQSDLNEITVVQTPLEEQTAIANYLDEKTAQIDKLIANKQRLIELLKEERTAIINEAVSGKGKNWERKKLKYVVSKVGSGVTPTGGANVYLQDGIPLLRSQNIFSDRLELIDVAYISEEIDEQMSNSRVQEGDVLLNITGASIGRCCFIPKNFGKGNVNQHVCILRPIQAEIKTEYLHSFLISSYGQILIDICQTGANREGLNFQQIKSFELLVPKIVEQEEIILHIKTETQKIVNTISKIEKEIGLLQEYRMALISEVVTGKINVTNLD